MAEARQAITACDKVENEPYGRKRLHKRSSSAAELEELGSEAHEEAVRHPKRSLVLSDDEDDLIDAQKRYPCPSPLAFSVDRSC